MESPDAFVSSLWKDAKIISMEMRGGNEGPFGGGMSRTRRGGMMRTVSTLYKVCLLIFEYSTVFGDPTIFREINSASENRLDSPKNDLIERIKPFSSVRQFSVTQLYFGESANQLDLPKNGLIERIKPKT